mgnify:CR=1 FL=1
MYKLTDLYRQLKEEEAVPTEPTPQYTLYCDMDGVLCNFDKAYKALRTGAEDNPKRFRAAVMDFHIFKDLEMMPDTTELLNHVSKLNVKIEILTSTGTHDPFQGNEAKYQKHHWLDSHNIPYKANFVNSKQEKAKYATPTSILIDDSVGCIDPFNAAGGHGILHHKASETIRVLDTKILQISAMTHA